VTTDEIAAVEAARISNNFYRDDPFLDVLDVANTRLFGVNPVGTKQSTAFFWSGKTKAGDGQWVGGQDVAANIAREYGGTTLEMLIENRGILMPEWNSLNPSAVMAWERISVQYAADASGTVRAVVGSSLRPGNIWQNVELPRLIENHTVGEIIIIDPATYDSSVIFLREPGLLEIRPFLLPGNSGDN
jgi:hypothetical protein